MLLLLQQNNLNYLNHLEMRNYKVASSACLGAL